uniref:Uncharacterized protein n=1 Tax=Arundo donax TaxID=35708 RepID=A0A0A8YU20_ARUDO
MRARKRCRSRATEG